ncbi:MAG: hypothetical protein LBQ31_06035 [Bacteroidales bacterium]|jgi:hypothetical protein|nr:hypothetical protein [Bacteroidales bacterium]
MKHLLATVGVLFILSNIANAQTSVQADTQTNNQIIVQPSPRVCHIVQQPGVLCISSSCIKIEDPPLGCAVLSALF